MAALVYYTFAQSNPSVQTTDGLAKQSGMQLRPPSLLGAGGHHSDIAATALPTGAADPQNHDALANTHTDGDWSIGPNGLPQPNSALRRRFDYFLLLLGKVSISDLSAHIRQQVQLTHGSAAAQQIMVLWENYLRLQQHPWKTQVNMQDPSTWAPALAERTAVRREMMGATWAQAFYGDEENMLRQTIAHANSAITVTTAPQAAEPIAMPDATQRLAEHEAQWEQWEQRLVAAQQRIHQLRNAQELSDTQRSDAIHAYIHQQFSGGELIRAKALLKL